MSRLSRLEHRWLDGSLLFFSRLVFYRLQREHGRGVYSIHSMHQDIYTSIEYLSGAGQQIYTGGCLFLLDNFKTKHVRQWKPVGSDAKHILPGTQI